jgi:hypothetical protein
MKADFGADAYRTSPISLHLSPGIGRALLASPVVQLVLNILL